MFACACAYVWVDQEGFKMMFDLVSYRVSLFGDCLVSNAVNICTSMYCKI